MVVAPLEVRIARIMADMNVDAKEAQKHIERFDNASHEFLKRYYHAKVEDPVHYDLVINTEHLSPEAAASIVVDALPRKEKQTGGPSGTGRAPIKPKRSR
jgi:cytidylate kinase